MSGIFAIGTKVYTDNGDRLFANQFGDGFVMVADFHEAARVSASFPRQVSTLDADHSMIDWIHAKSPFIDEIAGKAAVGTLSAANLEASVLHYIGGATPPPKPWAEGTVMFGSLSAPPIP